MIFKHISDISIYINDILIYIDLFVAFDFVE